MPEAANRYDRFEFSPALIGWEYEYTNHTPMGTAAGMATGLEIGVQLAGDWWHRGRRAGAALYGPRQLFTIDPGESYSTSFHAREQPGLQIGFLFYPDQTSDVGSDEGPLFIPNSGKVDDQRFVEFCRAFHRANETHAPLDSATVCAEVRRFVERHADVSPLDPILRAKHALDRDFDKPLYMRHISEIAGMHEDTFARRFANRFGVPPARYRLLLRLNEAARQTWARPRATIAEIAHAVGFDDLPYFHRAFRAHFGKTPAEYGQRAEGRA